MKHNSNEFKKTVVYQTNLITEIYILCIFFFKIQYLYIKLVHTTFHAFFVVKTVNMN